MTERRFNESEVAEIFRQATEAQQARQQQLTTGDGMTLAQLQEIAREVGIAPELVTQAARSIAQPPVATGRRFLGFPVGVGQTVEFGRRISDEEWERLVVDLRETFDAYGVVRSDGSSRRWTNGNLQALLEPTPDGHRLRLRTVKATSMAWMSGGLAMMGLAVATSIAAVVGGGGNANITTVTELGAIGLGLFAVGALQVPRWANERRQQMKAVASRWLLAADRPLLP